MWVMSAAPIWEMPDWADLPELERSSLEVDWALYLEEVHGARACRQCWKVWPLTRQWFGEWGGSFSRQCSPCRRARQRQAA